MIERLRAEIEARPSSAQVERRYERARREVVYGEIAASCALAGIPVLPAVARRLVEREIAPAGNLAGTLLVLGYARAALSVARERAAPAGTRRLVTVPEIERLHEAVTSPLAALHIAKVPQGWRRANLPPVREGMVTVPHWLIDFEMSALVDRIGSGPTHGDGLFSWLADAYERLERIRPFVDANGRTARLVVNLLLARLGYPPATIAGSLVDAYRAALRRADAGDRDALASVFERAVRANLERLVTAIMDASALRPLASFVRDGLTLDALRKAAQRGRLRTIAHGRHIVSTQPWIERYLAEKSRAGRRTRSS